MKKHTYKPLDGSIYAWHVDGPLAAGVGFTHFGDEESVKRVCDKLDAMYKARQDRKRQTELF